MAFRDVGMVHVKEILRHWVAGVSTRRNAELSQVDRKTVRRYVQAAVDEGLVRNGDLAQLTEGRLAAVMSRVQPGAPPTPGSNWQLCEQHRGFIAEHLDAGLRLTKVHVLLGRTRGVTVPYRTLHRFAATELGLNRPRVTVRVDDPPPGKELQVDFGKLGFVVDPETGQKRGLWALVFTACYSRHSFVWPTFDQTFESVIDGFEAAWSFFGGVFDVVIPDNMKTIVDSPDALSPKINASFLRYAQSRGFAVDPARVRSPQDKPRVERMVPYVRSSFFAGEVFDRGLDDIRARAVTWCLSTAGTRRHGTTRMQPLERFTAEERDHLKPAPTEPYDIPIVVDVLVHHDHHIRVGEALYSVPTQFVGRRVTAHADRQLVRIYHRNIVIKTHPRMAPGQRSTDVNDYPPEVRTYATRDAESLIRRAYEAGDAIGRYAERLLEHEQPWTRMRHVYRLLGLLPRYGAARVAEACRQAADLDVYDAARVARVLEHAAESSQPDATPRPLGRVIQGRFARSPDDFNLSRKSP